MNRRVVLLPLTVLLACANANENDDAGVVRDAGVERDGGNTQRDGGDVERDAGEVERDGGSIPRDGGPPPPVVDVKIAYTVVNANAVAELWVTESSTISHKVHPALAGGKTTGGKGEEIEAGVFGFEWIRYGEGLVYEAQQDSYDRKEIYFVQTFGDRPDATTYKQSRMDADGQTFGFRMFETGRWLYFLQRDENRTNLYIRRSGTSTISRQLNRGQPSRVGISSADYVAFQDVDVDGRDLWIASPSGPSYRVNPGANVGFGEALSWAPGGREIAYTADENESRVFELYRHDVTTGENGPRELMHPRLPSYASVSAGGGSVQYSQANTHLAYLADADTDELVELYEIDLSQAAPRTQVKINPTFMAGATGVDWFAYNPDGDFIAFVADLDTPGVDELYVARSGTQEGEKINIAVPAGQRIFRPRWIDAEHLFFFISGGGSNRAFVADLSTFPPAPATELSTTPLAYRDENRSPSGRYIVYLDRAAPWNLWLTDMTATPLSQTMLVANVSNWCWAETGELAVVARRDDPSKRELYLIQDVQAPMPIKVSTLLPDASGVSACRFAPEPE